LLGLKTKLASFWPLHRLQEFIDYFEINVALIQLQVDQMFTSTHTVGKRPG
jgi:hypothetical protein